MILEFCACRFPVPAKSCQDTQELVLTVLPSQEQEAPLVKPKPHCRPGDLDKGHRRPQGLDASGWYMYWTWSEEGAPSSLGSPELPSSLLFQQYGGSISQELSNSHHCDSVGPGTKILHF
jgi:hypothetical protein